MDTHSQKNLKLVKFWAPWCLPCLAMKPVVDSAVVDYSDVKLVSINIDEDNELAIEYKIRTIPTLLLMEDNREIDRLVGSQSVEQVKEFISNRV